MTDYTPVYAAINMVRSTPAGPDAGAAHRRLMAMVDDLRQYTPEWSLLAAVTDYTPSGLRAYRAAVAALRDHGTERVDGVWQSVFESAVAR